MFELRNETEIWYKSEDMYDWIYYGNLIVIQPSDKNNMLKVTKFNFESKSYELETQINKIEYLGKEYHVLNGYFEIEEDAENYSPSDTELIQAELLLNQAEIMAKQKEHDEVLAELLLGQQGGI